MKNVRLITKLFLFLLVGICTACGGGTTGTGVQTYEGQIVTTKEQPLQNVKVTILETGATDTTDANGSFSIPTEVSNSAVNLKLEGDNIDTTYQVKTTSASDSKVRVTIHIDEVTRNVEVTEFAAEVAMVGQCDHYFQNDVVIRQTREVPPNTTCTLKVILYGDGKLQGDLPVELQVRGCDPFTMWHSIDTERTGVGLHRGVAQLSMDYQSSKVFCEYRVLAPVNVPGYSPLDYRVHTYRYEALNK